MKLKSLKLKNIAKFDNFEIQFNNDITRLVGVNGSGKTTVGLTAIQAGLKGIAENNKNGQLIGERFRFIGNNGSTGDIIITIIDEKKGAEIVVKNKVSKSGNSISFEAPEGYAVSQEWLNDLLSVGFLSAKHFTQLSGRDQAVLLGIDTSKYDAEIKQLKTEFTAINSVLKTYSNLTEVEAVEPVDVSALVQKKDEIRKQLNDEYLKNKAHNDQLRKEWEATKISIQNEVAEHNRANSVNVDRYNKSVAALSALKECGYDGGEVSQFIEVIKNSIAVDKVAADLYPPEPEYVPEMPSDEALKEIDDQILAATETNAKAQQYIQYKQKLSEKQSKEAELEENKSAQKSKEQEKLDYIKTFKFGFKALEVDEEGQLVLDGRPIKEPYFSKGELEIIVAKLHASIDPRFKVRFIDDFEALDEDNQAKILDTLLAEGFQVITAEVGKTAKHENTIILKECQIVESYEDQTKNNLI